MGTRVEEDGEVEKGDAILVSESSPPLHSNIPCHYGRK